MRTSSDTRANLYTFEKGYASVYIEVGHSTLCMAEPHGPRPGQHPPYVPCIGISHGAYIRSCFIRKPSLSPYCGDTALVQPDSPPQLATTGRLPINERRTDPQDRLPQGQSSSNSHRRSSSIPAYNILHWDEIINYKSRLLYCVRFHPHHT